MMIVDLDCRFILPSQIHGWKPSWILMTLMTTPYSIFFAQMAKDFRLPQYLGSIVHTPTNNRFGMKGQTSCKFPGFHQWRNPKQILISLVSWIYASLADCGVKEVVVSIWWMVSEFPHILSNPSLISWGFLDPKITTFVGLMGEMSVCVTHQRLNIRFPPVLHSLHARQLAPCRSFITWYRWWRKHKIKRINYTPEN